MYHPPVICTPSSSSTTTVVRIGDIIDSGQGIGIPILKAYMPTSIHAYKACILLVK